MILKIIIFWLLAGTLDVAVLWVNFKKDMNLWLTVIGILMWPWILYRMLRPRNDLYYNNIPKK